MIATGLEKGTRSEEELKGTGLGKVERAPDTEKKPEPLLLCAELALKWSAIKSCKSDEDCFTCKSLKQLPIPHYCKVDHCVRTPLLDFHFFLLVMSRVGIRSMINIGNNQI